jgi:hypothetical protein
LNTGVQESHQKEQEQIEELRYRAQAKVWFMRDISTYHETRREAALQNIEEIINKKESQYRKRVGPEHFSKELEVMAEMKAFYSYSDMLSPSYSWLRPVCYPNFGGLKTKMQQEFRYYDANSGELNPANEPWANNVTRRILLHAAKAGAVSIAEEKDTRPAATGS